MRKPTDFAQIQIKMTKTMKKKLIMFANVRGWTLTHAVNVLVQAAVEEVKP